MAACEELIKAGTFGMVFKCGATAKKLYTTFNKREGAPYDAVREIAIIKALSHRNVVAFRGAEISEQSSRVACVMELADLGSLESAFRKRHSATRVVDCWSIPAIMDMLTGLWAGLQYLHENGVVHRDIKPDNILLFANQNGGGVTLKIADFGSAIVHTLAEFDEPRTDPVTTLWYRAPEVAFGLRKKHGPAMDVWAAGLVSAEMLTGSRPLFSAIVNSADLARATCYKFGTPTAQNNLMPSYYDELTAQPVCEAFPVSLPAVVVCVMPIEPFFTIINNSLCVEPTRRAAASWVAKRLNTRTDGYVPMERTAPTGRGNTARMTRAPAMDPAFEHVRVAMGSCLFKVCVRLTNDSSRRTFQSAAAILDVLAAIPGFMAAQTASERALTCTCMGIACAASKLCETMTCLTPEYIADAKNGCCSRVVPQLTAAEVLKSEADVIRQCDWNLWHVTPLDMETAFSEQDIRVRYLRNYLADVICCYVGCGGLTPIEVDQAATVMAINTAKGFNMLAPHHLHPLMKRCAEIVPKLHGSQIHIYYSAVQRQSVSTTYTRIMVNT